MGLGAMQATMRQERAMIQTMRDPHPEEACVKEGESHGSVVNAGHDEAGDGMREPHPAEEACVKEGEGHGSRGNAGHDEAGEGYNPAGERGLECVRVRRDGHGM